MNEQNVILEEDGFEEEIDVLEETSVTLAMWGDITGNIENQTDLQNALDAKQDSLSQAQLDATNSGITSAKVAKYDGYEATINAKADQSALDAETIARGEADTALGTRIDNEVTARQTADNGLQSQIDAITSKSDVVDVVANYAALQNYDTSALGNNDVVKVLDDETHEDALTYYRWNATARTWSYIGQEAPYYSKGQMDVFLQGKQDKLTAGNNVQIQNNVISATDTTYTAGNGLNLNGTEFSADTTVLATKEDLEGYYTKPETDSLLAPKLEAEVVTELPMTGEDGKLYLTPKAHTTQTATGNPITATVAEEAGAIESFQLNGDTFQQSYTGKNLLGLDSAPSESQYGVSTTVDEASNTLTLNGTYNGGGGGYPWISYRENLNIPAGTYTVSIKNALYTRFSLRMYRSDGTYPLGNYIAAGSTSATITIDFDCTKVAILFGSLTSGETFNNYKIENIQLESGSSVTSFEPYVGGAPSPNPDYPQSIKTVTGEQTVTITGKNLFNKNEPLSDYYIDANGVMVYGAPKSYINQEYSVIPSSTLAFSYTSRTGGAYIRLAEFDTNGVFTKRTLVQNENATITLRRDTARVLWSVDAAANLEHFNDLQIEISNSASSYAPYHATSYPISLGNIELCKIGDYQDYIYKDGSEWRIRKATGSVLFSDAGFYANQIGQTGHYRMRSQAIENTAILPPDNNTVGAIASNAFVAKTSGDTYSLIQGISLQATGGTRGSVLIYATDYDESSATSFSAKMTEIGAKFYYALLTPTDTTITNQTLIAQLEAVANARLASGSNTISNSATGDNLAGDLEISYHGYDPRNRYDKWLWLDINNEYEQLGS